MTKNLNNQPEDITLLKWPECVRTRIGMYLGGTDKESVNNLLREIIDNSIDESYQFPGCNEIFIDRNFNGPYSVVADNGRGISIGYNKDVPGVISADVSISTLHSGTKWSNNTTKTVGQNGLGSAAVNAVSETYILMSKITQENYDKSLPQVRELWEKSIKSKKDLFYIVWYQRGVKFYEGALKKRDFEKMFFGPICPKGYTELPSGFSTIVIFKPDPDIFESIKMELPLINLRYFLLIQEKFYNRKVTITADGEKFNGSGWNGYQFNVIKKIIPQDPSMNKSIDVFVSFEMDPNLGPKDENGSVNGLNVPSGVHITYAETAIETALKDEYKIKHRYAINGLKICVILLASEVVYNSQTKEKLKSISKVKSQDIVDNLIPEIKKLIRKDPDYWGLHVDKVNYLANSMKSLSSMEKAEQLKIGTNQSAAYKLKNELKPSFVDATAGPDDRWNCTVFIVEGDSPAGSLISSRTNAKYQAVLPLRGRPLSTSGLNESQMLENVELYTLFKSIGVGLDCNNLMSEAKTREEALEILKKSARYGKIVISTDSDADGSIIASSVLYTIHRYARFLIDAGMVYVASSPTYSQGGHYWYPGDPTIDGEIPVGLDPKKPFSRYKGLGSLDPPEVFDAFFNPTTSRFYQITLDGEDYAASLVDDINVRKALLTNKGIITNPFNV